MINKIWINTWSWCCFSAFLFSSISLANLRSQLVFVSLSSFFKAVKSLSSPIT
jgi:hypothetical protein